MIIVCVCKCMYCDGTKLENKMYRMMIAIRYEKEERERREKEKEKTKKLAQINHLFSECKTKSKTSFR